MITDWTTGVPSPTRLKNVFLCVQTGSEAHPASYPMGTEFSSRVNHGRGVTPSTRPIQCRRQELLGNILLSPWRLHDSSTALLFTAATTTTTTTNNNNNNNL
jgi:hypothetical protein